MRYMVTAEGVWRVEGESATHLPDAGEDLTRLAAGGAEGAPGRQAALADLVPALPVRRPGKILCVGLNYAEHAREGGREPPEYPAFFMRAATSLVPAGAPIIRPRVSEKLDFEAELMIVVGRGGRYIAEETALEHVFGYTCFNDGSVRDYQRRGGQWTPGKNFDRTGAVGPVVVTPDELPAGAHGLHIESRVEGEVMQSASTADMIFPVARLIALISEFCTLEPGDLIATGTPEGVGYARTPPRWLRPGEVVKVEIEGIGTLRSPVADEAAS
ncbi:MAG: FAA hydrolase family protein [Alphaproteobacteria bacterium]|nr:MAG: FAA hydrolase family protein [Alphaproteobacteria bacterium]